MNFITLTKENISLVVDLYIQTFNQAPWNDHWEVWSVEKRLGQIASAPDFDGLLLYKDEQLIGFILGNQEQYYNGMMFVIKEFCIDPNTQGAGLGSILLKEFENYLYQQGISSILLMTLKAPQTKLFYEKNGYSQSDDLIMMNKSLK